MAIEPKFIFANLKIFKLAICTLIQLACSERQKGFIFKKQGMKIWTGKIFWRYIR